MEGYTMTLTNGFNEVSYGRILPWVNKQDAIDLVHQGGAVHPGIGLKILQAQNSLCVFLQQCCVGILHDYSPERWASSFYTPFEIPSLEPPGAVITTIADATSMSPYRVPYQIDYARIRALITARMDELEDHCWALREDPGYFAEIFNQHLEHRAENLRDENNEKHPIVRKPKEGLLGYVLRDVVIDSYYMLHYWHDGYHQLNILEAMEADWQKSRICLQYYDKPFPEEYAHALQKFWRLLHAITTDAHLCFNVRVLKEEGDCIVCLEMRADELMRHLISGKLTNYRVVRTSPELLHSRMAGWDLLCSKSTITKSR
jgi:hypothetical protein